MKKKVQRLSAKKSKPAVSKSRRLVSKAAPAEAMTAGEVAHLETLVQRFEASEKAWLSMTVSIDEPDHWSQVEEHMAAKRDDAERRWKFFSK
jgi:hypothetical protein